MLKVRRRPWSETEPGSWALSNEHGQILGRVRLSVVRGWFAWYVLADGKDLIELGNEKTVAAAKLKVESLI